jgi:hypothetical protein
MFCQGPELEVEEFMDIQLSALVQVIETPVLPCVDLPVDDPLFDQETAPQIVAVPGNEGIVEIE